MNYRVTATLIYEVEADSEDEAQDVVAMKTNNPSKMDGIYFIDGAYIVTDQSF